MSAVYSAMIEPLNINLARPARAVILAAMLLSFVSSCMREGPPKINKTNLMPRGAYSCEAGTLIFETDNPDAPSGDRGYAEVKFAEAYLHLLGGRDNDKVYGFVLDEWDDGSNVWQWHIYEHTDP